MAPLKPAYLSWALGTESPQHFKLGLRGLALQSAFRGKTSLMCVLIATKGMEKTTIIGCCCLRGFHSRKNTLIVICNPVNVFRNNGLQRQLSNFRVLNAASKIVNLTSYSQTHRVEDSNMLA